MVDSEIFARPSVRAFRPIRDAGMWLVDLVLPPRCVECGQVVQDQVGFCPECWASLHFLIGPACARCDRPLASVQGEGALCGACMADLPPYDRVIAPLAYCSATRDVVMRLKYGRRVGTARLMARIMAPPLNVLARDSRELTGNAPLLVPVPLHRWRLWWRGFNQSALLAQHLARECALPLAVDALLRTRSTKSMRGLGARARARVVRGAFAVSDTDQQGITGRHVILVDDVLTSGATAAACSRTLLAAGAARVSILAFTRVIADDSTLAPEGH